MKDKRIEIYKINLYNSVLMQLLAEAQVNNKSETTENFFAVFHISIAHDGNNTKESCIKNPLPLVNGDELAVQSRSAGTGKKTKEEINGARGYPVFMTVAE
ncbi:MAG: hypothetical protein GY862_02855 [Gammaproteobacteria bacterium]|nr:hypothetical protein [Gammaproteobacteria bacterium]